MNYIAVLLIVLKTENRPAGSSPYEFFRYGSDMKCRP